MARAGWKICVNDRRMQKKLELDSSFVGFLDGSRALRSGETWPVQAGSILGVEPEFAVRFDAAVPATADAQAIRRAVGGVAPALEVVDWREAKLDLHTMAASSSFHAGFVVGELRPFEAVPAIADGCPLFRRGDELLAVPDHGRGRFPRASRAGHRSGGLVALRRVHEPGSRRTGRRGRGGLRLTRSGQRALRDLTPRASTSAAATRYCDDAVHRAPPAFVSVPPVAAGERGEPGRRARRDPGSAVRRRGPRRRTRLARRRSRSCPRPAATDDFCRSRPRP